MSNNQNRDIYTHIYTEKNVTLENIKNSYDRWFIDFYFSLIEKYGKDKDVLDLCCGAGSLLLPKFHLMKSAIGLDFSSMMLETLVKNIGGPIPENLEIILGDANHLPIRDSQVDFVYSITSLYHVPDVAKAISETARVLRPGGIAALELGNLYSINTIVAERYYKEQSWAKSFHIPYQAMLKYLSNAGFSILEQRAFQLTSNYGVPRSLFYLQPVSGRYLKKVLGVTINNKMLDEYISSCWPFRNFAFRHMFICQKS